MIYFSFQGITLSIILVQNHPVLSTTHFYNSGLTLDFFYMKLVQFFELINIKVYVKMDFLPPLFLIQ